MRQQSYNRAALIALQTLSRDHVDIDIASIEHLPLFNPDREGEAIAPLSELKSKLSLSEGLIIASPEYAHGISGVLKNALDWLVSGDEVPGKPVMLINTSPRAHHAQDALKEVLRTMSLKIIDTATLSISLLGSGLTAAGIVANGELSGQLRDSLSRYIEAVKSMQNDADGKQ